MDGFAQLEADGVENAVDAARKMLVSFETLHRITDIINETRKQKVLVESQLSMILSAQTEEAHLAMDILRHSFSYVQDLQRDFEIMDQLCRESQNLIDNYKLIRELHMTLRNVTSSRNWLRRLIKLKEEVAELEEMLADPSLLLEAHEKVQQLESLRDTVLSESEEKPELFVTFESYFEIIGDISKKFYRQVWKTMEDVIELSQDDPAAVVRVLRVIEREEALDREYQNESHLGADGNGKKKRRKIRGYMGYCYQYISTSVMTKFENYLSECGESVENKLSVLSELLEDLKIVQSDVAPCFPESYRIVDYFNTLYQGKTKQVIDDMIANANQLSVKEKLALMQWLDGYRQRMEWDLELEPERIFPLDEKETINKLENLIMSDTSTLMREWTERIIIEDFKTEPERNDEDGHLYTLAPIDMFKMLDQQVEIAKETKRPRLLKQIVESCKSTLKFWQDRTIQVIESRFADLSLETLCAYCNNCQNSMAYLDEFQEKLEASFGGGEEEDDEFVPNLDLNDVRDGLSSAAQRLTSLVSLHIFNIVEEAFKGIFKEAWYRGETTSIILETYQDTFQDLRSYLEEYWFFKVTAKLLERTVTRYVEALLDKKNTGILGVAGKGVELTPEAAELMEKDIEEISELFKENFPERLVDKVTESLNPIRAIQKIVAAENADDFHFACVFLLEHFPDVTSDVVENIVKMRVSLDKDIRKQLMDMLKVTFAEEQKLNESIVQHADTDSSSNKDNDHDSDNEDNTTTSNSGGGSSYKENHSRAATSIFAKFSKKKNADNAPGNRSSLNSAGVSGGLSRLKKLIPGGGGSAGTRGSIQRNNSSGSTEDVHNLVNGSSVAEKDDMSDIKVLDLSELLKQ